MWEHFTEIKNKGGKCIKASCNYCRTIYACDSNKNGIKNLLAHTPVCKKYPYRKQDKKQKQLSMEPKEEGGVNLTATSFSVEACQIALAKMIIIDELSFKFFENEGFKLFMGVPQPKLIIPSRTTIARDCLKLYGDEKKKLKHFIHGRRLSLTTDTWTSVQNINYMCLTAHFIDEEWRFHKKILNFCQVDIHKGEDLGKVIETCLLE
ncbi:hypothetical protein LguiA_025231 [Lonicera macranthoides]